MQLHISEIVSLLRGHIIGEWEVVITHPCTIEQGSPGGVTFLANPKYNQYLTTTQASLVLIGRGYTPPNNLTTTLLVVDDPYLSFGRLLAKFHADRHQEKTTIEFPSYIGQQVTIGQKIYRGAFSYIGDYAKLGDHVKIYPQTYIGDYVTIGNNTIIYSGAKIYPHTTIGNNCIIHAGAVIGSDGFSFAPSPDGIYEKIPSLGHVIIEDNVEIGANTTIDSGMIAPTHIQEGVKIDNLVQIAHNVQVGAHSALAAQVGIAGSAKMGTHCKIGGQVGINGHIRLGNHTIALGRAGITKSFPQKGNILSGTPAFDNKKFLTAYAHFKNLPQLANKVENLSSHNGYLKKD